MISNQIIVLELLNSRINNFINTFPEEVNKIEQEEEIEDLNYEDDEDSTEYEDTTSDAISKMIEAGRNKVSNTFVVRDRRNAQ